MAETDFAEFDNKTSGDRVVMHILYGMHTIAWASMGTFAVIALIVNYIKRADEQDPLYLSHHSYMISTFWWTILWLVVTSPLWLLIIPVQLVIALAAAILLDNAKLKARGFYRTAFIVPFVKQIAYPLGINIIFYAMTL